MMNKTQLFIRLNDSWVELDLSDNGPFPIILNISDVRDISKKNSSYSKTITLPHTNTNSNVLNFIFDVANDSTFNVNRKVRAYVLNDTIQVFEGFFQLVKIKTDNNSKFEYECVIFGETDTLIKNIGEGFLTDIDISGLNHLYNKTNIENSWVSDWSLGYYYPLIDYNNRFNPVRLKYFGAFVKDFKPGVYVKYLWNKIFQDAGFTYDSNFLNSTTFNNLIIPFGGNVLKRDPQFDFRNTFLAQLTGTQSISAFNTPMTGFMNKYVASSSSRINYNNDSVAPAGDPGNKWNTSLYEYTENNEPKIQRFGIDLDLSLANFAYADNNFTDANQILGVNAKNIFTVTLAIKRSINPYTNLPEVSGFSVPIDGLSEIDGILPFSPDDTLPRADTDINKWTYRIIGGLFADTDDSTLNAFTDTNNLIQATTGLGGFRRYRGTLQTILLDDSSPEKKPLRNGEKLWVEVRYNWWTSKWNKPPAQPGFATNISTDLVNRQTQFNTSVLRLNGVNNIIFNEIQPDIIAGQPINIQDLLPEKIKKKDFITSIIKMFNLFIEPNKNNVNNLLIEPRDDYYALGGVIDWSDKLDISKSIEQDMIAEAQNRKLLFTYKEDKDKLNIDYKTDWNEVYGQFEYDVDNDFITGEKRIDVIFHPTPIINMGWLNNQNSNFIIPQILPNDASLDVKNYGGIKILLRATQSIPLNDFWLFEGDVKTSYPYAGHFDNPFNPDVDINWGQTKVLFYPQGRATNNNLFNNYYRKMIEELTDKDSRIISAYFYLTPQDLYDLRFYDSIFVQSLASSTGNYFKINKIEYDPMVKDSYKVELLKANDINIEIVRVRKPTTTKPVSVNPTRPSLTGDILTIGNGNAISGEGVVSGSNNIVSVGTRVNIFGDKNIIQNNPNFFTFSTITSLPNVGIFGGSNNIIRMGSNSAVILGADFSEIGLNVTKSAIVGGTNNKIVDNIENGVIIGGSGEVLRQSNMVKLGGTLMSSTNFVGAGRDEVLNRFPQDKVINFISAGRDEVREYGTNAVENIVSGGYDFTI
jgi:hypothetical protein